MAIILLVGPSSAFYIIPQDSPTERVYMLSPLIKHLSPPDVTFPIVSRLVYTADEYPTFNPAGAILVYQARPGLFHEDVVQKLNNSGIAALVVQMLSDVYQPGYGEVIQKKPFKRENTFPVFELTFQQSRDLTGWFANQTTRGVIVSFDSLEANPWQYNLDTLWPAAGIVGIFTSGITLIGAAYKLTLMAWVNGAQLSVGQWVLGLVIVAMTIRFVWCIVDPFGAYGVAHFAWVALGLSLAFPFVIGNTLLISLYWHEMITKTGKKVNLFLNKMLIPFLIFIFLLIAFEFCTALTRGLRYYSFGLLVANAAVYCVVVTVVLAFFLVTKIRLALLFRRVNKTIHSRKKRRLGRANVIVACMAVVLTLFLIPLLMIASAKILWEPKPFSAIWVSIEFGIDILAFLQVLLIRAPDRTLRWFLCGLFVSNPAALIPSEGSSSLRHNSSSLRTRGTHSQGDSKAAHSTTEMRQWSADDTPRTPSTVPTPYIPTQVSAQNSSSKLLDNQMPATPVSKQPASEVPSASASSASSATSSSESSDEVESPENVVSSSSSVDEASIGHSQQE